MGMDDEAPITRRECASVHTNIASNLAQSLTQISEKLDDLNGSVARNTKFRVESSVAFRIAAIAWASLMAPLTAILVAVLR